LIIIVKLIYNVVEKCWVWMIDLKKNYWFTMDNTFLRYNVLHKNIKVNINENKSNKVTAYEIKLKNLKIYKFEGFIKNHILIKLSAHKIFVKKLFMHPCWIGEKVIYKNVKMFKVWTFSTKEEYESFVYGKIEKIKTLGENKVKIKLCGEPTLIDVESVKKNYKPTEQYELLNNLTEESKNELKLRVAIFVTIILKNKLLINLPCENNMIAGKLVGENKIEAVSKDDFKKEFNVNEREKQIFEKKWQGEENIAKYKKMMSDIELGNVIKSIK
jgi:hypothetical protein